MRRRGESSAGLLLLTLLFFAGSILHTSVGFYKENHAVQVPLISLLNHPSLFPGDPFAEALRRYPSMLWHVVAGIAQLAPLGPLLFSLLLLERLAGLYAVGRLARAFAPGSILAPAGSMALFAFAIRPLLGAGTIVESYFEQTGLAIVLLLLAAAAFYEHRRLDWAMWTGLALDATGLYGAYALTYFGAVFLIDREYRRSWRRWLGSFGLLVVIALPCVILSLRALGHPLRDKTVWLAASYARSWRHMYPGVWPLRDFVEAAALLGVVCAYLLWAGKKTVRLRRQAAIWSTVAASWIVLAFLAASISSPSLLVAQPARGTDVWVCLASVALVAMGARAVERPAAGSVEKAASATVEGVHSGPVERVTAGMVEAAAAGTAKSAASAMVEKPALRSAAGTPLGTRALLLLFLGPILFWRPLGWSIAAGCALALIAWPRLWEIAASKRGLKRLVWLLALWVCASGIFEFQERMRDDGPIDALVSRPVPQVAAISAWAKENTAKDAVFLLDPGDTRWEPFRALSERMIYTSWEEGTAINWSPSFASEWARRMRLLGYDVMSGAPKTHRTLRTLYAGLTWQDVSRIRAEVPFRYWIIPVDQPTGFREVFRAGDFKVLDLEGEIPLAKDRRRQGQSLPTREEPVELYPSGPTSEGHEF